MERKNICFGKLKKTFIIAEIGQNHQGDLSLAKKLIKIAKDCGADCVKFQKSDLKEKFTESALSKPYTSFNSFGRTYGEHKAFLEFSQSQFKDLQSYSKELDILFTASAMDLNSLSFLTEIQVPFIKIGSGDANNFRLIEEAAKTGRALVISTGMQDFKTVQKIYSIISLHHKNFALLHCVSAYPLPFEEINLNVITLFKEHFPDITIGYSGHEVGTHISVAAVTLGSKVIERHLTLDKTLKGTDHKCSLEPLEFKQLVDNIRSLELALGVPVKAMQTSELSCYDKLGKTLVYVRDLKKDHILSNDDLILKVAVPKGIDGKEIEDIIGNTLNKDVEENESSQNYHFY